MIEGVVAVVRRADRYLLIRRAAGVVVPHAWCFVGGAIEPGESQAEAVVREFAEELGGRVEAVRKIWEYTRPDARLRLHWWEARLLGDELVPNVAEVAAYRWCTVPEIECLPNLLDSNRAFLVATGLSGSESG